MAELDVLKTRLGLESNEEDEILEAILESSKHAILTRRYPYHDFPTDGTGNPVLESRYSDLCIRIAAEMYSKIGAEGETAHKEGELTRQYESAGISSSLLKEVIPKAGVL